MKLLKGLHITCFDWCAILRQIKQNHVSICLPIHWCILPTIDLLPEFAIYMFFCPRIYQLVHASVDQSFKLLANCTPSSQFKRGHAYSFFSSLFFLFSFTRFFLIAIEIKWDLVYVVYYIVDESCWKIWDSSWLLLRN